MCKMETKTKMYPDGSTYKRQILHLCSDSNGTTPCISYRDSDESLVEVIEPSPLLPPVKEIQLSPVPEPAQSKEKRRYLKLGTRLIQVGSFRKKEKDERNRNRRSLEPKPNVVIVQSASRGQDSVPEAPTAPTARPLYETSSFPSQSSTVFGSPRLGDPIVLEAPPPRRRRPTSGVSFAEDEPIIIEEAPTRRRRPTSGVSFIENVQPRSTPPHTPRSTSREHRRTEYLYDYPRSPASPPRTPQPGDDSPTQRHGGGEGSGWLHHHRVFSDTLYPKDRGDLDAEDVRQARLELSRADAREAARLHRRLQEAQLDREVEAKENEREADLMRTMEHMAKERKSAEARERAERAAEEALEIQRQELRRQEERAEEIRRLERRLRYHDTLSAEQPQLRSPELRRYSSRPQPVIIQAPRDQFREEGHRVLAEARRERELEEALERLDLASRGDDAFEEDGLGRRITISGGRGRRSESYYRDRARRRREFWVAL